MQTPVTSTSVKNHEFIGRDREIDAYSIEEFCRRHGISRGTYYNMKADGSGPKEKHAKGRVIISKESAQAWRAA